MTQPLFHRPPLVITDRAGRVLLDLSGDGLRLPRGMMRDEPLTEAAAGLVAHMRDEADAMLLPLWAPGAATAQAPDVVVAFLLDAGPTCPWQACPPEEALGLLPADEGDTLRAALSTQGQTSLGASPAWLQSSWWCSALQWLEALLHRQGLTRLPGTRVLKSPWGGSAVLALATSGGDLVFKVSAGEPPEAEVLALLQGDAGEAHVPTLVGHDLALGCLVMRPFSGRAPTSVEDHARAVAAMARLQSALAGRAVPPAIGQGAIRRDGAWLREQLSTLLIHVLHALVRHGMADGALLSLEAKLPEAARLCADLDGSGWPLMLHHEDFRPDNVVLEDPGVCIFDWADTAFGHPAWSLQRYLQDLPPDEAWREPVTRAYLDAWSAYLAPAVLARGLRATRLLAPLYELARYNAAMDVAAWAATNPLPGEQAMARDVTDRLLVASRSW